MKKINKILGLLVFILIIYVPCFAENYKVLYVSDGDTVAVKRTENDKETGELIKVRLFGIDAPEINQDYGYESKQTLINFIRNKNVKIYGKKKDRYGRVLGTVYYNNENINEKMVKTGNAWWYEKYDKKNVRMKQYQEAAQKNKLGIFAKKNYISPWEFRKIKREKKKRKN
ncbi:thermonuclease family protein [Leptotrichia sp. OH3620_COT-345]|uniref:thermonuclease family protein n=1 Tax=Leptotrichia sp. OH3620_COT-345 TaxID=2491048 RepID=UPI001F342414|nr:thermonuclease family protein [Leptotrichia sp. OH3620_COT-345]